MDLWILEPSPLPWPQRLARLDVPLASELPFHADVGETTPVPGAIHERMLAQAAAP